MVRRCRDLASLFRDVSIKSSNVQKRFLPEQDHHSRFNLHQSPRPPSFPMSNPLTLNSINHILRPFPTPHILSPSLLSFAFSLRLL